MSPQAAANARLLQWAAISSRLTTHLRDEAIPPPNPGGRGIPRRPDGKRSNTWMPAEPKEPPAYHRNYGREA